MDKEVKIYFKVDGLDTYLTDLNDLKKALGDVNTATEDVTSSTKSFESAAESAEDSLERSRQAAQGFKGAVDILGGSVEVLVGGLGLLGAQPEWLENIEDGATKAIAFADGMSRLADGINDVMEFMNTYTSATRTNTAAIQAQDTATKAATVSTRTLSTVLKGVGIGLVIAGVAALIANYEKLLGLLGIEKKVFDTSTKDRILQLEKELRIAELRGENEIQLAGREQELADLRRKNAKDYVNFLINIGAEESEINAATEEAIQLQNDYEVAIVKTNKARQDAAEIARAAQKEFDEYQTKIINDKINSDPNIYGTEAYFNRIAESIKEQTDNVFLSTRDRINANKELTDAIIGQAQAANDAEIDDYNRQLEEKKINKETYDQLVLLSEEALQARIQEINEDAERRALLIQQEGVQKRFDLAQKGVAALIELNDATAGASEEQQRKAFERNKKLQTGLALIQTAQAVTAALTAGGNPVKLATGAQFIEAAIVAATGLANVIKIQNTTFDGGGGGSNRVSIPSVNPGNAINYNFGQQAGSEITLGQLSSGQRAEPLKAYVLVSDVNNAIQADYQIQNLSKL